MAAANARVEELTRQQQILLHELQHRVKNVLAAVGSLASRMLKFSPMPTQADRDFSTALLLRLRAMGVIQEILARSGWESADFRDVIVFILEPYCDAVGGKLTMEGPELPMKAAMVSTLGMAIHELGANAAQHGALSHPAGRLAVIWRIEDDGAERRLIAHWGETGGPAPDHAPEVRFGIDFIRRSIAYELDGTADFDFAPQGLTVLLEIPIGTR